ncbi:MAG: 3-isopropylmalate dehydratase large subunit [Dehalococcoidia bacterium]
MGMTMAEKILAGHAGKGEVKPGEYVWCNVDGTAILGHSALLKRLESLGVERLFDPERIYAVEDHMAPPPTIEVANAMSDLRKLVRKYGITHFFEYGRHGILHELFPHHGYVSPGDLIVSIDSHSTSYGCFNVASTPVNEELIYVLITGQIWLRVPETIRFHILGKLPGPEGFVVGKDLILRIAGEYGTDAAIYRAVEFTGPAVKDMSMASRFSMANMSIELGAKFGIFPCDDKTLAYLDGKMRRIPRPVESDPDASFEAVHTTDVTDMAPYVARPHDPGNSVPVTEVEKVKIDQAFIGSCTNARMEDFRMAARIITGRRVHPDVRLIATPASQDIWRQCAKERIWDVFSEAGALITNSTCGACPGWGMGVLGDNEVCISSSNRNFQGRMGSPKASVYLANPATVAASAVTGHITDPRQFL